MSTLGKMLHKPHHVRIQLHSEGCGDFMENPRGARRFDVCLDLHDVAAGPAEKIRILRAIRREVSTYIRELNQQQTEQYTEQSTDTAATQI